MQTLTLSDLTINLNNLPEKSKDLEKNKKASVISTAPQKSNEQTGVETYSYSGTVMLDQARYTGVQLAYNGELKDLDQFGKQKAQGVVKVGYFLATSISPGAVGFKTISAKAGTALVASRGVLGGVDAVYDGKGAAGFFASAFSSTLGKPSTYGYHGLDKTIKKFAERSKAAEILYKAGHNSHHWQDITQNYLSLGLYKFTGNLTGGRFSFAPNFLNPLGRAELYLSKQIFYKQPLKKEYKPSHEFSLATGIETTGLNPDEIRQVRVQGAIQAVEEYKAESARQKNDSPFYNTRINVAESTRPASVRPENLILNSRLAKVEEDVQVQVKKAVDNFEKTLKPKNKWVEEFERILIPEKYQEYDKAKKYLKEKNEGINFGVEVYEALLGDLVKGIKLYSDASKNMELLKKGYDYNSTRRKKLALFIDRIRQAGGDVKLYDNGKLTIIPPKQDVKKVEQADVIKSTNKNVVDNTRLQQTGLTSIQVREVRRQQASVQNIEREQNMAAWRHGVDAAKQQQFSEKVAFSMFLQQKMGVANPTMMIQPDVNEVARKLGTSAYALKEAFYYTPDGSRFKPSVNVSGAVFRQGR